MTAFRLHTMTTALALVALLLTGCSNWTKAEQGAGIGAASGAVVGAGVGYAADGGQGAVIGGLAGALAGGTIGYVVGDHLEDEEKTLADHPEMREELEQPTVNEVFEIERLRISPSQVLPGDEVTINVIHAYVGKQDQPREFAIEVTVVDDENRLLINETKSYTYHDGTYSTDIPLQLPADLPEGTYAVNVTMSTDEVSDNRAGSFLVI